MGLYLCIFEDDNEIDGVEVGSYADFNAFRDYLVGELEGGKAGSRFPTLIMHSDCDGEWSVVDCPELSRELAEIEESLNARSAVAFTAEWQKKVAKSIGLAPKNAYDSFIDVDGEPLVRRLMGLVDIALKRGLPILFQ